MMRSGPFTGALFLLLALASTGGYAAGKTMVFSMQDLPTTRDFTDVSFSTDFILMSNITEGLFSTDIKGRVVPAHVDNFEVSKDGLEYQFHLRDDIFWSNGERVVAQDYVRAWQRSVEPKIHKKDKAHLNILANYEEVASGALPASSLGVSALSKKQLQVKLNRPMSFFSKLLTLPQLAPVPSTMSEEALDNMFKDSSEALLSSGPFQLVSMSDSEVVIKKNQYYWDRENTYFEEIRFSKSRSVKSSVISVVAGRSDLAELRDRLEIKWIEDRYPKYLKDFARNGTEYYTINLGHELLGENPQLREAMSMSIDRDKIVHDIIKNGSPAYNFVPSGMFQEREQNVPVWAKGSYLQRVEKAKSIVEAYKQEGRDIPEINLKIKDEPQTYKVAFAIKVMWEKIGLSVNIEEMNIRDVYKDIYSGNYQVARAAWIADYNDPYNFLYMYGKDHGVLFGPKPVEKVDSLLEKALSELNQKSRESLYVEIEDVNHQHNAIIPLYHYQHSYVLDPSLRGIEAVPVTDVLKWAYRD